MCPFPTMILLTPSDVFLGAGGPLRMDNNRNMPSSENFLFQHQHTPLTKEEYLNTIQGALAQAILMQHQQKPIVRSNDVSKIFIEICLIVFIDISSLLFFQLAVKKNITVRLFIVMSICVMSVCFLHQNLA